MYDICLFAEHIMRVGFKWNFGIWVEVVRTQGIDPRIVINRNDTRNVTRSVFIFNHGINRSRDAGPGISIFVWWVGAFGRGGRPKSLAI